MELKGKNASALFFKGGALTVNNLCIAAHQDDVEIMAYGQIAECYEHGGFAAVVLTDGAGSLRCGRYAGVSDEEMKKIRFFEQCRAAEIGNYDMLFQLAYSSDDIKKGVKDVEDDISSIILATLPEKIFIHNFADKHDTHVASALRTLGALRGISDIFRPGKVYMMEVWRGLDWLNDNAKTMFDTAPYPELAERILNVYDSQIAGGKEYTRAAVGRRFANATFFESHSVDSFRSASIGVEITEFVYSDSTPCELVDGLIESFRTDALKRLSRVK
ncbi:MAG: PIG-L family deacetylase [Clostridia bacterium]|nr:PIG-L family deacetylase [Clostridia bacterium]